MTVHGQAVNLHMESVRAIGATSSRGPAPLEERSAFRPISPPKYGLVIGKKHQTYGISLNARMTRTAPRRRGAKPKAEGTRNAANSPNPHLMSDDCPASAERRVRWLSGLKMAAAPAF